MNDRVIYRASIRIHEPTGEGKPAVDEGEFVSVHTTLAVAQRELTGLHNTFGGRRVTDNILVRDDGRTYRIWCV